MSLVGHWPLHEQTGRANDLSGNGNHGTVTGATRGVAGKGGLPAYSFDGTDDSIDIPSGILSSGNPYSTSIWLNPNTVGSRQHILSLRADIQHLFAIGKSSTGSVDFYDGTWHNGVTTVSPDEWTLFNVVYNGTITTIYKNSTPVASFSGNASSDTGANMLFKAGSSTSYYYNGSASGICVYDHSLTPKEIEALYQMGGQGAPPDDGVAYYPLPGTDSTITDYWGSNTGTLYGGTWVDGRSGNAIYLDGTDDYIDLGNWAVPETFAIGTWVNLDTNGDNDVIFDQWHNSAGSGNVLFRVESGVPNLYIEDGGGTTYTLTGNTTLATGNWHYLLGMWDGSNQSIYIDGKLDATNSLSITRNSVSDDTYLGARVSASKNYLDGSLDDVRVYDRGLREWEITALAENHGDLAPEEPIGSGDAAAVARWPLDYAFTSPAEEIWNGNDGTRTGTTYVQGVRGKGLSFDGTDDYIDISGFGYTAGDIFTISAWAKPNNNSTSNGNFLITIDEGGDFASDIGIFHDTDNTIGLHGHMGGDWPTVKTSKSHSGEWVHIVGIVDDSSKHMELFINGISVGTASWTSDPSKTGGNSIGARSQTRYFDGIIDDVRVYSRVLEPQEIRDLFRWGTRGRDMAWRLAAEGVY